MITKGILIALSPAGQTTDDTFFAHDPYGFVMAILGMGIVFTILLLLYIVFTNTPKLFTHNFRQQFRDLFSRKKGEVQQEVTLPAEPEQDLTGEVNAAIAAAIHLYRSELHDFEDTVLTMKKVSRTYSPWSSKIYGLRNLNQQ